MKLNIAIIIALSINSCYATQVNVGDKLGGGIVFCVSSTPDLKQCVPQGLGEYGLIMSDKDQANLDSNPQHGITWSSKGDVMLHQRFYRLYFFNAHSL
jgi:hypothetical protein